MVKKDITNEFESWEDDASLFYNEKWEKLLKLREKKAKDNPNDYYAQYYLGEAYNLNKKYNDAIKFMYKWHKKVPSNMDFIHVILDALFALGKNENDIKWIIKPKVVRINSELIEKCYKYIKSKKNQNDIYDLYDNFLLININGYFAFSRDDLIKALRQDNRFLITNENSINIRKK